MIVLEKAMVYGKAEHISSNLADFLSYLRTGIGNSPLVKKIDAEVKKARSYEEWKVEYMTWQLKYHDIWDEGYDNGYDSGVKKGLVGLARLVEKGIISPEVAAEEAGMTLEEFLEWTKEEQ